MNRHRKCKPFSLFYLPILSGRIPLPYGSCRDLRMQFFAHGSETVAVPHQNDTFRIDAYEKQGRPDRVLLGTNAGPDKSIRGKCFPAASEFYRRIEQAN